jgi:hypothetical protein
MLSPGVEVLPYSEVPIAAKIRAPRNLTGNYVTVSNISSKVGDRWYIKRTDEIRVESGNLVYLTAANRTQTLQFIKAGSVVGRARIIPN